MICRNLTFKTINFLASYLIFIFIAYIKNGEISFSYQKKKYVWDDDKKVFNKLRYPIDMSSSISIFQNSKGLENVNEIKSAQEKYGFNRFDRLYYKSHVYIEY